MLATPKKPVAAAPQTGPTQGPAGQLSGNALFEALVCEFHWTVLQIGAITCCMNACLTSGRVWMLRSCVNLLPVEARVVRLALGTWQDLAIPRDLASRIGRVYFELFDAKKVAMPIIDASGSIVGPKVSAAKLQQIAAVWRKLSEDCGEIVQDLEPETRWRLAGLYTANTLVLGRFLKDAVSGSHSCVDQHGGVGLPLLPQRRRTHRHALSQGCKVVSQGGVLPGFAQYISRTEIGFECAREFKAKEPAIIEFNGGRAMKGVIVWCRGGKAALQFDTALEDSDPMIAA